MRRPLSRRFGPPGPKRPRARRPAGRRERRTAVAPATAHWYARPARAGRACPPASGRPQPPTRRRFRDQPRLLPPASRRLATDPMTAAPATGAAPAHLLAAIARKSPQGRPPPGGTGPPPRRRRGSGSATRPGSAPRRARQASGGRNDPRRAKSNPPVARLARARALSRRFGPPGSKRPRAPGWEPHACLCERPRLREAPRPRRACGSPRRVAPADEERAPPHAAGSGRTPPSRPPRRGAAGVPLRRRRCDGGPAPPPRRLHSGPGYWASPARPVLLSGAACFGDPALVLRVPPLPGHRGRRSRWQKSSPTKARAPARHGIGHWARSPSPLRSLAEAPPSPPPGGTPGSGGPPSPAGRRSAPRPRRLHAGPGYWASPARSVLVPRAACRGHPALVLRDPPLGAPGDAGGAGKNDPQPKEETPAPFLSAYAPGTRCGWRSSPFPPPMITRRGPKLGYPTLRSARFQRAKRRTGTRPLSARRCEADPRIAASIGPFTAQNCPRRAEQDVEVQQ